MLRSTNLATQSATVNALRHLYALAEVAKLKRGADVEIRVIAFLNWTPPKPGVFVKETMMPGRPRGVHGRESVELAYPAALSGTLSAVSRGESE